MRILLLLLLWPFTVAAQTDALPQDEVLPEPYTVTDVIIDVTASNAVEAREEAFTKASEIAVKAFLEAQGASSDLKGRSPDSLVKDFKVEEERFSDTRYKARFTYRLKPRPIALLANQSLPLGRQLPVPAAPQNEQVLLAPLTADSLNDQFLSDPDAPRQPRAQERSFPPSIPSSIGAAGALAAPQLYNWQLTVRYEQVPDWLLAQNLIQARPEVRGFRIRSVTGAFAILDVTSGNEPDQILSQWQSLGWRVSKGAGGLVLDAGSLR